LDYYYYYYYYSYYYDKALVISSFTLCSVTGFFPRNFQFLNKYCTFTQWFLRNVATKSVPFTLQ